MRPNAQTFILKFAVLISSLKCDPLFLKSYLGRYLRGVLTDGRVDLMDE